jgi:hypothetical protein
MNALTGRRIPTALGLGSKLTSPTDTAIGQPEEFQGGVRMILDTLRAATSRVDLIAVGSVRDVTAAYNREPDLLRARAGRVLVFIGEASNPGFREYNVELDPHAYVGLMRSGLDVHWVPCFDGGLWKNEGHASFWQVSHRDVLERAPPELIQFFVYALEREMADPLRFVRQPVNPVRRENLFRTDRNLWCTAVFASLTRQPAAPAHGEPFGFEPVDITITDGAVVEYPGSPSPGSHRIWRFRVLDRAAYASRMTQATADLLARFAVFRP